MFVYDRTRTHRALIFIYKMIIVLFQEKIDFIDEKFFLYKQWNFGWPKIVLNSNLYDLIFESERLFWLLYWQHVSAFTPSRLLQVSLLVALLFPTSMLILDFILSTFRPLYYAAFYSVTFLEFGTKAFIYSVRIDCSHSIFQV